MLFHEYIDPKRARVRGGGLRRRGAGAVQRTAQRRRITARQRVRRSSRWCCWSATSPRPSTSGSEMDVTTFMATICPIAAAAVLPLAIVNGDVFEPQQHGMDVHADPRPSPAASRPRVCSCTPRRRSRSARSGSRRSRSRRSRWSGRTCCWRGHQRPAGGRHRDRHGRAAGLRRAASASTRSRSVMKCDAARIRSSAARPSASSPVRRASASRAKTSAAALSLSRAAASVATSRACAAVERSQQAVAEDRLLAAARLAVELRGCLQRRPGLGSSPERAQHPPQVHARERGETHVAGGLGLRDRALQRRRTSLVVAGLTLRPAEARLADTPRSAGTRAGPRSRPPVDVVRRRRRSGARRGRARPASRRPNVQPRVVDLLEPRWTSPRASRGAHDSPAEIAARGANSALAAWSHGGAQARARRVRSARARAPTHRGARRHRRGSRRSSPSGRRRRRAPPPARCDGAPGRGAPLDASIHAVRRSASAELAAPGRGQEPLRATAVAEHDPRPAEPGRDAEPALGSCVAHHAERRVDVRALGARERQVFRLRGTPHARRSTSAARSASHRLRARSRSVRLGRASSANARMLSSSRYRLPRRRAASGSRAGRRCRSPPSGARRVPRARIRWPPAAPRR